MKIEIRDATREDADLIADAILGAIGEDLTDSLAGEEHTREDVHNLFADLARRDDSQYSWLNSRIAVADTGEAAGVCVSYDGADLIELRKTFFEEATRQLGWEISEEEIASMKPETTEEEYYLDSLMTLPEYRGRGVARQLILDADKKAVIKNKPLGLLCDKTNTRARRLYESVGFKAVGKRPFAGHDMDHLQLRAIGK
ncbi:MAG: GNAT family N-acetyltransferase [Muribaculaceae bacterium]|nr:GNAT family N-acetyltransferase [Muribaculaceae bacterium]